MGHKHRDLEDIEMVRDPELTDKSLELVETAEDREELSLPLANSTIKMEEAVTKREKSESINGVSVPHQISVKKKIDDIRNDLTYFKL